MKALLICCRVNDPERRPIKDSQVKQCEACGSDVSVSQATLAHPELKGSGFEISCTQCANLDGVRAAPTSQAQLDELKANGYDPANVPFGGRGGRVTRRS